MTASRTQALCLGCATYECESNEGQIRCKSCGFTLGIADYDRLVELGRHNVLYGHSYRGAYEEQVAKGKIETAYSLSLSEVWAFIGVAALSGIIGGLAGDAVKAACKRIVDRYRTRVAPSGIDGNLPTEEDISTAVQHVDDFVLGLDGVDENVIKMIRTEMAISILTEVTMKYDSQPELLKGMSEDDIKSELRRSLEPFKQELKGLCQITEADRELIQRCFRSVLEEED